MTKPLLAVFLLAGGIGSVAVPPGSSFACPSDLDPSFGTGGIGQLELGPGLYGHGDAVLPLPTGEILVAASVNNSAAVLRYDQDGLLDTDFGSDGVARLDYTSNFVGVGRTASGAIVAGGADGNGGGPTDFLVARFDPSGLLDPSFGQSGVTTTRIGPGNSWIRGITLLGDGRLVAVGQSRKNDFEWNVTVACYDEAGALDPAFGDGGIVTFTPDNQSAVATGVARLDDDSVVLSLLVIGSGDTGVAKLQADGELDLSFGEGGIRISRSGVYEEAWAMGTDALGRIYVGGSSAVRSEPRRKARLFARRYLPDGSADLSYGRRGKAGLPATRRLSGRGLAVSGDGVATVVGYTGRLRKGLLARFSAGGGRDLTFGRRGLARLRVGDGTTLWGAALQDDGRLLVTGSAWPGPLLARYESQWDGNGQCVIGCGNGVLSRFEECDDGNISDGDGCSAACTLETRPEPSAVSHYRPT